MAQRERPPDAEFNDDHASDAANSGQPPFKRPRGVHVCLQCTETFTEKRSLVRHVKTVHVQSTRVQCAHCSEMFSREDVRKRHERRRHPEANSTNSLYQMDGGIAFTGVEAPVDTLPPYEAFSMNEDLSGTRGFSMELAPIPEGPEPPETTDSESSGDFLVTRQGSTPNFGVDLNVTPSTSFESEKEELGDIANAANGNRTVTAGVAATQEGVCSSLEALEMAKALAKDEKLFFTFSPAESPYQVSKDHTLTTEMEILSVTDSASVLSVSSRSSRRDRLTLPLELLRSRLSLLRDGANPRGRSRKTEVLCMLCKKPFGYTQTEIRRHLDRHNDERAAGHQCTTCQVGFDYEADLRLHQRSAEKGHCGFRFEHEHPCCGHHPPAENQVGLSDHDRIILSCLLSRWEEMERTVYLAQVQDLLSNSNLPPDVDSWSINHAFSRSMASLCSRYSNITTCSAPNPKAHPEKSTVKAVGGVRKSVSKASVSLIRYTSREQKLRALAQAAVDGDIGKCKRWLAAGADVNLRSEDFRGMPLYLAAARGHLAVVKLFQEQGAIVDHFDDRSDYGTALSVAVAKERIDVISFLLESGATIDGGANTLEELTSGARRGRWGSQGQPLLMASARGETSIVRLLLSNGVGVGSEQYELAMQYAAHHGDFECVRELLQVEGLAVRAERRVKAIHSTFASGNMAAFIALVHGFVLLYERLVETFLCGPSTAGNCLQSSLDGCDFEALFESLRENVRLGADESSRMTILESTGITRWMLHEAFFCAVGNSNIAVVRSLLGLGIRSELQPCIAVARRYIWGYGSTEMFQLICGSPEEAEVWDERFTLRRRLRLRDSNTEGKRRLDLMD